MTVPISRTPSRSAGRQVEAGGIGVAGLDPVGAFVASRKPWLVLATVARPASVVLRLKML